MRASVLVLWLPVLACESEAGFIDPGQAFGVSNPVAVGNVGRTDRLVQMAIPSVDALFVVDNSCSMTEEQALLGSNFPSFLEWFQDSGLDYHIGVVSTDMVDPQHAGRLREVNGLRWVQADTASPEAVFASMAVMGTDGHYLEKGRAAAWSAVELLKDDDNQGFVRDGAGMHITVVSDENDDSGDTPIDRDDFVTWLQTLRPSRQLVSFSSIVGPVSGCPDIGTPGTEYLEVTRLVGGVTWPICADDWSEILDELGFLAVGLSREFYLSERPIPGTIAVSVEDGLATLQYDEGTDWTYDAVRNSVVFVELVPDPLSTVVVTYEVLSSDQGPLDGEPTPTE